MDFRDLTFLVDGLEEAETGQGASDSQIAAAEERLGVGFPDGFRKYIEEIGWLAFEDLEVFGLGDDVPSHLDLVRVTESERTDMRPQLPQHLLPLANDGAGNYFCVDVSTNQGGHTPVVFWDHEAGEHQSPQREADDFVEWLYGAVSARTEGP